MKISASGRRGAPSRIAILIWIGLSLFPAGLTFAGEGDRPPAPALPGIESIRAEHMQAILTFLASDELEGREATHRGLKVAAKFLASQYRLAGLTPPPGQHSMLQPVPVIESRLAPTTAIRISREALEQTFTLYHDFYLFGRFFAPRMIQAPVAFVGYGISNTDSAYDDYQNLDVRDKIVLLLPGMPEFAGGDHRRGGRRQRSAKIAAAQKAGAAAVLYVSSRPIAGMVQRLKRWLERPGYALPGAEPGLAQFFVSEKLADALLAATGQTLAGLKQQIDSTKTPHSMLLPGTTAILDVQVDTTRKRTQNVVAYLEGADPQRKHEIVAFGAHYDHLGKSANGEIYNGADDDGSGTTAILEIARAFAQNPNRPARSLLFISHTAEEKGLLGSRYFTDHPPVPLENIVTLLNIDMIGRNAPDSVYVIGSNFLSKELHRINENASASIGITLDYTYNKKNDPNRFYYRSDHYNYAKHDIPIAFFFSGTHEDYHKPTDTVDKINFAKMEKIARLVYLTGWTVANLDHRVKLDGPEHTRK